MNLNRIYEYLKRKKSLQQLMIFDMHWNKKKCEERREKKKKHQEVMKIWEEQKINWSDILYYNCGIRGYTSHECYNKQKCFNCQGYNHIAADCKELKRDPTSRGRRGSIQGTTRGKGSRRGHERSESTSKINTEVVLIVNELIVNEELYVSTILIIKENENTIRNDTKVCIWLLDSGATMYVMW